MCRHRRQIPRPQRLCLSLIAVGAKNLIKCGTNSVPISLTPGFDKLQGKLLEKTDQLFFLSNRADLTRDSLAALSLCSTDGLAFVAFEEPVKKSPKSRKLVTSWFQNISFPCLCAKIYVQVTVPLPLWDRRLNVSWLPFSCRSATVTPTGSPKKRHLPQIPSLQYRRVNRETKTQDFDERAQIIKQNVVPMQRKLGSSGGSSFPGRSSPFPQYYYSSWIFVAISGWDRHYVGLSDTDLPTTDMKLIVPDWLSPEKEIRDSDMESVVSVTSSAFSTQSERLRGLRYPRFPFFESSRVIWTTPRK